MGRLTAAELTGVLTVASGQPLRYAFGTVTLGTLVGQDGEMTTAIAEWFHKQAGAQIIKRQPSRVRLDG